MFLTVDEPNPSKRTPARPARDRANIERIIGNTCESNNGMCWNPRNNTLVYLAGSTVVVYCPRRNRQISFLTNDAPKTFSCISVSSSGNYLATGEAGHQPRIVVWDMRTGGTVAELKNGHQYGIRAVAFSPSENLLVSVGFEHDRSVTLWEWGKERRLGSGKAKSAVSSVSFDPSGKGFITAGTRHLRYWMVPDERKWVNAPLSRSAFALESRPAAVGQYKKTNFVAVASSRSNTGTLALEQGHSDLTFSAVALNSAGVMFQLGSNGAHADRLIDVKVDGGFAVDVGREYVACGCGSGIIRVFHAETFAYIATLPRPPPLGRGIIPQRSVRESLRRLDATGAEFADCVACRFSPDGSLLAGVYSDRSLFIWDISELSRVAKYRSFVAHGSCIWDVDVIQPKQEAAIVTASADGSVRVWSIGSNADDGEHDAFGHELVGVAHMETDLGHLKAHRDSPSDVAPADRPSAAVRGVGGSTGGIRTVRSSPDGRYIASGDRFGNLRVHDARSLNTLVMHEAHDGEVLCLDFTGKSAPLPLLVSGSRDRLIHVFEAGSGFHPVQTLDDHSSSVTGISFSPAGDRLVSCSADKSIVFRHVSRSGIVRYNHAVVAHGSLHGVSIDSAGKRVRAACQDRGVAQFSVDTGKLEKQLRFDHGTPDMMHFDVHPDGRLAVSTHVDRAVRLVDLSTGKVLSTMRGHGDHVTRARFLHNTGRIVSTGGDGCIFVWKFRASGHTKRVRRALGDVHDEKEVVVRESPRLASPSATETDGEGDHKSAAHPTPDHVAEQYAPTAGRRKENDHELLQLLEVKHDSESRRRQSDDDRESPAAAKSRSAQDAANGESETHWRPATAVDLNAPVDHALTEFRETLLPAWAKRPPDGEERERGGDNAGAVSRIAASEPGAHAQQTPRHASGETPVSRWAARAASESLALFRGKVTDDDVRVEPNPGNEDEQNNVDSDELCVVDVSVSLDESRQLDHGGPSASLPIDRRSDAADSNAHAEDGELSSLSSSSVSNPEGGQAMCDRASASSQSSVSYEGSDCDGSSLVELDESGASDLLYMEEWVPAGEPAVANENSLVARQDVFDGDDGDDEDIEDDGVASEDGVEAESGDSCNGQKDARSANKGPPREERAESERRVSDHVGNKNGSTIEAPGQDNQTAATDNECVNGSSDAQVEDDSAHEPADATAARAGFPAKSSPSDERSGAFGAKARSISDIESDIAAPLRSPVASTRLSLTSNFLGGNKPASPLTAPKTGPHVVEQSGAAADSAGGAVSDPPLQRKSQGDEDLGASLQEVRLSIRDEQVSAERSSVSKEAMAELIREREALRLRERREQTRKEVEAIRARLAKIGLWRKRGPAPTQPDDSEAHTKDEHGAMSAIVPPSQSTNSESDVDGQDQIDGYGAVARSGSPNPGNVQENSTECSDVGARGEASHSISNLVGRPDAGHPESPRSKSVEAPEDDKAHTITGDDCSNVVGDVPFEESADPEVASGGRTRRTSEEEDRCKSSQPSSAAESPKAPKHSVASAEEKGQAPVKVDKKRSLLSLFSRRKSSKMVLVASSASAGEALEHSTEVPSGKEEPRASPLPFEGQQEHASANVAAGKSTAGEALAGSYTADATNGEALPQVSTTSGAESTGYGLSKTGVDHETSSSIVAAPNPVSASPLQAARQPEPSTTMSSTSAHEGESGRVPESATKEEVSGHTCADVNKMARSTQAALPGRGSRAELAAAHPPSRSPRESLAPDPRDERRGRTSPVALDALEASVRASIAELLSIPESQHTAREAHTKRLRMVRSLIDDALQGGEDGGSDGEHALPASSASVFLRSTESADVALPLERYSQMLVDLVQHKLEAALETSLSRADIMRSGAATQGT